jgi:hypothetical protein
MTCASLYQYRVLESLTVAFSSDILVAMTLAARNGVLYTGIGLNALLLIAFGLASYGVLIGDWGTPSSGLPQEQIWFGRVLTLPDVAAYYSVGVAGVLGSLAVVYVSIAARIFRRVSSAEVYFFTLFLITLSPELLRVGQLLVTATDQPPLYGALVTRVVLFGRLLGYLVLFAAGVYAAGARHQRIGTLTLLICTLAFLVVYFVPVDLSRLNATLIHRVGGRQSLDAVLVFLSAGTIANYVIAWATGRADRGVLVAGWIVALVVGRELAFNVPTLVASVIGVILIGIGALGFMMTVRTRYLWY